MKSILDVKKIISILFFLLCSKTIAETALKIKNGIVVGYRGSQQYMEKTLLLPSQVTAIARQAFEENQYLKEVVLSNCKLLRVIDYAAFQRCESLEYIEFPKNIEMIAAFSFNYCKRLLSVDLSNCSSLLLIDEYAFNKCENLKTLKLPQSLKRIGSRAFYRCNNLKEIDLSHCKNLEYIGEKVFDFSRSSLYETPHNVVIKLPFNVTTIYENTFGVSDYCSELLIPKGAKELKQKIIKSGFPEKRIREY
jgi:Leucine Rich Repeat.